MGDTGKPQTLEDELRAANEIVYKHSLELARLKEALEIANAQQENLLHFISHEIKGYLTEGQNAFAGIVEGDYGEAPPRIKALASAALEKMRSGVATVMNILDAANLKKGTVTYKKEPFDFREVLERAIRAMRARIDTKQLALTVSIDSGVEFRITGDEEKIEHHVVRNLIDNAIRYTPQGSIQVRLARTSTGIRFSVKDTGVGITREDMSRLFTEGGHGKDSIKINVDSTGYGLFIAKQVVEAHGGRIWAESAGAGEGAEFIVELPAI